MVRGSEVPRAVALAADEGGRAVDLDVVLGASKD